MSRLSYLLTLTPRETWRIVRHKLPGLKGGPSWTPDELLSSAKHARGIRFAELLLRQEASVRRVMPWAPLEFSGKHVVEVGCGPLAGYGPLAIFLGADRFSSAEPEWDPGLFFSEPVSNKYLRIFHADLVGLYGARMSFEDWKGRLRDQMAIETTGFETSAISAPADVMLSQSVIEHVFPLEPTIAKMASLEKSGTRHLHLVDFGNHYPTANPFDGLYHQPADDYIRRRGRAINCLRLTDVARLLDTNKVSAKLVSTRVVASGYPGTIHPWWRDRYDDAALFTQLALAAGTRA